MQANATSEEQTVDQKGEESSGDDADKTKEAKAKKQMTTKVNLNMKLFWEGSNHIKLRNHILNNNMETENQLKKKSKITKDLNLETNPEGEEYSVMPNKSIIGGRPMSTTNKNTKGLNELLDQEDIDKNDFERRE
jgi:hypothetical protein